MSQASTEGPGVGVEPSPAAGKRKAERLEEKGKEKKVKQDEVKAGEKEKKKDKEKKDKGEKKEGKESKESKTPKSEAGKATGIDSAGDRKEEKKVKKERKDKEEEGIEKSRKRTCDVDKSDKAEGNDKAQKKEKKEKKEEKKAKKERSEKKHKAEGGGQGQGVAEAEADPAVFWAAAEEADVAPAESGGREPPESELSASTERTSVEGFLKTPAGLAWWQQPEAEREEPPWWSWPWKQVLPPPNLAVLLGQGWAEKALPAVLSFEEEFSPLEEAPEAAPLVASAEEVRAFEEKEDASGAHENDAELRGTVQLEAQEVEFLNEPFNFGQGRSRLAHVALVTGAKVEAGWSDGAAATILAPDPTTRRRAERILRYLLEIKDREYLTLDPNGHHDFMTVLRMPDEVAEKSFDLPKLAVQSQVLLLDAREDANEKSGPRLLAIFGERQHRAAAQLQICATVRQESWDRLHDFGKAAAAALGPLDTAPDATGAKPLDWGTYVFRPSNANGPFFASRASAEPGAKPKEGDSGERKLFLRGDSGESAKAEESDRVLQVLEPASGCALAFVDGTAYAAAPTRHLRHCAQVILAALHESLMGPWGEGSLASKRYLRRGDLPRGWEKWSDVLEVPRYCLDALSGPSGANFSALEQDFSVLAFEVVEEVSSVTMKEGDVVEMVYLGELLTAKVTKPPSQTRGEAAFVTVEADVSAGGRSGGRGLRKRTLETDLRELRAPASAGSGGAAVGNACVVLMGSSAQRRGAAKLRLIKALLQQKETPAASELPESARLPAPGDASVDSAEGLALESHDALAFAGRGLPEDKDGSGLEALAPGVLRRVARATACALECISISRPGDKDGQKPTAQIVMFGEKAARKQAMWCLRWAVTQGGDSRKRLQMDLDKDCRDCSQIKLSKGAWEACTLELLEEVEREAEALIFCCEDAPTRRYEHDTQVEAEWEGKMYPAKIVRKVPGKAQYRVLFDYMQQGSEGFVVDEGKIRPKEDDNQELTCVIFSHLDLGETGKEKRRLDGERGVALAARRLTQKAQEAFHAAQQLTQKSAAAWGSQPTWQAAQGQEAQQTSGKGWGDAQQRPWQQRPWGTASGTWKK